MQVKKPPVTATPKPIPTTTTSTPTAKPTPGVAAQIFQKAAVATEHETCSKIGRDILKQQGSAVDALIASQICVGALNMFATGIGGGGFMIVYNRKLKHAEAFDYREVGPSNMTMDMYNGRSTDAKVGMIHFVHVIHIM